jgi:large subunit ribosomal protein L11
MSKKASVKVMVEGGAATPGPPLGPALGPLGVNAAKVVEEINKKTAGFRGMRVPVEVLVDPGTKQFEIVLGSPPTSALLIKALGAEKGGGAKDLIGDLSLDQVMEVAKSKQPTLLAKDLKAAVKEIVGSCQSLRISIMGLTPKEMTEAIQKGILDDYISGKTNVMPKLVHKEEKFKIVGVDEKKPEAAKEAAPEAEGEAEGDKKADAKGGKDAGGDKKADAKGGKDAGGDKKADAKGGKDHQDKKEKKK